MTHSDSPAGIKEIAKKLGVSIGTVDRALHGRAGISDHTRKRVLQVAAELNYRPNLSARNLKLSKRLRIGVFLPEEIALFFDLMRSGIREAAARAGLSVDLDFHSFPRLGEGDVEALEAAAWNEYDGIILAPGGAAHLSNFFRQARYRPPTVFVASDAPRIDRLSSVTVDASVSGAIAADLLGRLILQPGKVAVITGDRRIHDHSEKLRGFAGALATTAEHLSLLPPIESHEKPEDAYESALLLFRKHKNISGVYISTANSLPVLKAAEERKLLGRIKVVTTDLFPEVARLIAEDQISCSLYQRPYTQGRLAFELLHAHLSRSEKIRPAVRLAPHIVLRSNLRLFTESADLQESDRDFAL